MADTFRTMFAKSNRIPTTHGWKHVGELTTKDYLFDLTGRPVKIQELMCRTSLAMTVKLADGRQYICSEYSRLNDTTTVHKAMCYLKSYRNIRTLPSEFHKPAPGPAMYPAKPVPIEPYLLGMLCTDKAQISTDRFVIQDVTKEMSEQLATPNIYENKCIIIEFKGHKRAIDSLKQLYHGGLDFIKTYIAQEYLTNSITVRRNVLAGIVDTTGRPLTGCCRLSGITKTMKLDILELANSLGMIAIITKQGEIKLFSENVPSHRERYCNALEQVKPPANAGHVLIRNIECKNFTRSTQITLRDSSCKGILIENYIPALI